MDKKMQGLEVLRGLAAILVLVQHIGESEFPLLNRFTTDYFNLGAFGVMLFFLISGFLIPQSIERQNSLKTFWKKRLLRLFPLYWFSLIIAFCLWAMGHYQSSSLNSTTFISNVTMFQKFLGQQDVIGVYWTLNIEMIFYILASGLFVVGMLKKTKLATAGLIVTSILLGFFGTQVLHVISSGWGYFFYISNMFMGTLLYRIYTKQNNLRSSAWLFGIAALSIVMIAGNFSGDDKPPQFEYQGFVSMLTAWLLAYVLFICVLVYKNQSYPKILLFLGKISYSIYLMQILVISVVPRTHNSFLTAAIWIVCTLLVSSITFYMVERPFMKLNWNKGFIKLNPSARPL